MSMTRNIDELKRLESLKGEKIQPEDVAYITKYAMTHRVMELATQKPKEFSKERQFFQENQLKLIFIKGGKEAQFCNLDMNKSFIAFKIQKQKMFIYGYFPQERKLV